MNSNITDSSKNDESVHQQGMSITAGDGSIINTNSGNTSRNWLKTIPMTLIVGILLASAYMTTDMRQSLKNMGVQKNDEVCQQIEKKIDIEIVSIKDEISNINKNLETSKTEANQAREGTIWLLRHDILSWIQKYTDRQEVSQQGYKLLMEEFDHYKSIGGNHDVSDRIEDFKQKIFGTGEVKMTPSQNTK